MSFGNSLDGVTFPIEKFEGIQAEKPLQDLWLHGIVRDAFQTLSALDAENRFPHIVTTIRRICIGSHRSQSSSARLLNEDARNAQFLSLTAGGANGLSTAALRKKKGRISNARRATDCRLPEEVPPFHFVT